jgi:hypothetical protein
MRLSCCAPLTYDSTPPIGPSWNSRSFKAKAPQIVVGRIGRDRIGHHSGGLQELERFFISWTWRSRCVGAASAPALSAAVERGGMITSTGGSG